MSRPTRLAAAAALFLLSAAGAANAHAHLVSAKPPQGGMMASAPTEIDLSFSEELNLKFTGVEVKGPDGSVVELGPPMLMDAGKTFMAMLKGKLAPGAYDVSWHAVSRDGHKTLGNYSFIVKP